MDEIIIDTVAAECVEVGDLIQDPNLGTIREVSGFSDEGEEVHILLEDDDEPHVFQPYDYINLYGYERIEV